MNKQAKIRRSLVIAGLAVFAAGTVAAQDTGYGRIGIAPSFEYQHDGPAFGSGQSFNCAGGGGQLSYNVNSWFGLAMDLGGCHAFSLNNTYGVGSRVNGDKFTYVFGPRFTYRKMGHFEPFFAVNFGGDWVKVSCNTGNLGDACGALAVPSTPTTPGQYPPVVTPHNTPSQLPVIVTVVNPFQTSASKNSFAMTVGGGFDYKINHRFSVRVIQAEYLYTHHGAECEFAVCYNNTSQNNFRLDSGIVMSWGEAK